MKSTHTHTSGSCKIDGDDDMEMRAQKVLFRLIIRTYATAFHISLSLPRISVLQVDVPSDSVGDLFVVRFESAAEEIALCRRGVELKGDGAWGMD